MKNRVKKAANWFSGRKLKQKVRILFIIIMGFYLLLFLLIYLFVIRRSTEKYIAETNHSMLLSIGSSMEQKLDSASTVSKWIMNSQEVLDYLKCKANAKTTGAYALNSIYQFTTSEKHISSVLIFKNNGEYIHIANGQTYINKNVLNDTAWKKEIKKRAGSYVVRVNGGGAFQAKSGKPVISLIRQINDIQTQKPIGLLAMNYSIEMLSDTYSELAASDGKFGYFDKTGKLLCGDKVLADIGKKISWNASKEYQIQKTGGNKTLYCHQIPDTPLMPVLYKEVRIWDYVSAQSLILIVAFVCMTIVSLMLIGLFMSFYITKPIERLGQSMDGVKNGWLKRVSLQLPNDEMGHLKDSYNNMLIELNHLIEQLIEKETAVQQAELEILQEQIRPHFLYNTLDTIGYLALQNPGEEVYDAIETLGSFYRKFLSKGSRDIPLNDEIEIIRNYLKLQKLRYEDVFTDEYNLQPELLDIKVPKLTLQPLVENALYHGVRLKGEKGVIKLSVYSDGAAVAISIYDTGVGMTKDEIRKITTQESKSFGLKKTIQRLQNYYGVEDIYEIRSNPGYDCEIILRLPYDRKVGI